MHHITLELLQDSYDALKHNAAAGVDDETWYSFGEVKEDRLPKLHDLVQSGRYRAKPSKRIWLLKPDGRKRPIGITALEDKIVQKAVVYVLNAIYEEDFVGFSYGFRPGCKPHDALDAVWVGITRKRVNWVLDVDIRSFFDRIDHEHLMKLLEIRIADPRMQRLVRKWLRAGVSEDGEWSKTTVGTPQGSVISPLLANVYLHYVFDKWMHRWRSQESHGDVIAVRYADDIVMGFQHRNEAEQFLQMMRERLGEYGLELHPAKTRLVEFGRFAMSNRSRQGKGKPETFEFLGFTHICAKRRSDGGFTVWRRSVRKRMGTKLKQVRQTLMRNRHKPVAELGRWLRSVVHGFFNYHAVPCNIGALQTFRREISRAWLQALQRRSQKGKSMTWQRMRRLEKTWIPPARIKHPYPNQRLTF